MMRLTNSYLVHFDIETQKKERTASSDTILFGSVVSDLLPPGGNLYHCISQVMSLRFKSKLFFVFCNLQQKREMKARF